MNSIDQFRKSRAGIKKKNKENKRILIVNFKNTSTYNIFESTIRIEEGIIFRIFNLTWIRKCSCHQSTNGLNYSRSPADDSRDNPPPFLLHLISFSRMSRANQLERERGCQLGFDCRLL